MDIGEYAWNKHEQKVKEQTVFSFSTPKIKIVDSNEMRNKLEELLEQLPQKLLARWALRVSVGYIQYLDSHLKDDPRIELGIVTLKKRIAGLIGAYDLRKVGFIVNQLAKESNTEISRCAARSFAQAIATGHMRGHALVSSDYGIKLVNLLFNNSLDAAVNERNRQIACITELLTGE